MPHLPTVAEPTRRLLRIRLDSWLGIGPTCEVISELPPILEIRNIPMVQCLKSGVTILQSPAGKTISLSGTPSASVTMILFPF